MDRRFFLAGASALSAVGRSSGSAASRSAHDPLLIINSLGAPDDTYGPKPGPNDPLISAAGIAAAHASGVAAINITVSGGLDADFDETLLKIASYDQFVSAHPADFVKVLSAADVLRARARGEVGLIYGFQGAAMLGDNLDRIDTCALAGVRIIQLTYNTANQLGGGSLAPADIGLSAFGRAVIDRLNHRRIVVDLSHGNQQTTLDAAHHSAQPIAITHTGCRALADIPRNKTDAELRLVADKGGYVGIYFMPFVAPGREFSSKDVASHIDHAVNVCGEDHVGIGTDHGLTALGDLAATRSQFAKLVNGRRRNGISAPGEDPKILPYGQDLTGPHQFRVIAARLRGLGYRSRRIEKIMGRNFLHYVRGIWGN